MLTAEQIEARGKIVSAALAAEKVTRMPACFTAAQCELETGYLQHMPPGSNNCFGIKAYVGARRVMAHTREWFTDEQASAFLACGDGRTAVPEPGIARDARGRACYIVQDWFAVFDTLADCFRYRTERLMAGRRYASAVDAYLQDGNVRRLIASIAPVYATDPNYGPEVTRLAFSADMQSALKAAAGSAA